MKRKGVLFLFLLLFALSVKNLYATELLAEKTGKDCSYCHKDISKGKDLTRAGEKFLVELKGLTPAKRIIRFITYFIHLFFAITWFGTILYVHLILKPSYAAGGLPRGELLLGWTSIFVMAITGTILTFFKIDSFYDFFDNRYGIILSLKIFFYLIMVSSAIFVTLFLGPKMRSKINREKNAGLGHYDGKEGRQAYIAYNGKVYDVTNSKLWPMGVHMGRHFAGEDLTRVLKLAPHGEDVLERFKKVDFTFQSKVEKDKIIRVFYFLAYTNLVIVFIIIFLITLWKW
ncbi:MAG: cytochrome B5 [Proteobacteria bacterium]|nr:cytochrome B5 [Pseudomonadota bacterium]